MMLNGHTKLAYILESPPHYESWRDFRHDVETVARCGYQAVELQMRTPGDLDNRDFARLLEDCDLRLLGVQTGSAYLKHGICLASPDPAVRGAAMDLLRRYIDGMSSFGAVVVFGLLQGCSKDEPDRQRALERIRSHLRDLATHAEAAGVLIAMEPVNRYECSVFHNTVADVLSSVELIDSPSVRAMVDTFHVNIEETGQQAAIRAAAPVLAHVHLSETNRGLFGTGHLDFGFVFSTLYEVGYTGAVSIGVYRDEPSVAERARHSFQTLAGVLQFPSRANAAD